MYLFAKLLSDGKRSPMYRTIFPKIDSEALHYPDKLLCMVSKKIPINCEVLEVTPNGPLELLLAVIAFCHQHEISLMVHMPETETEKRVGPEDERRYVLQFFQCSGCGARFSSAFHYRCPHCGGWGYEPHYEENDSVYKKCITEEDSK